MLLIGVPHRVVTRLGEFDVRERFAPVAPAWVAQIGFAIFCVGLEAVLRLLINVFAPGAAPFALVFPAIFAATLFAGWECGVMVLVLSGLLAWYFVLPTPQSFDLSDPADTPRIIVIALSGALSIALADIFRRAVRSSALARSAQLEERDLLLREIDHRTKNNFMMVASLVDIQRRRASDPAVKDALTAMLTRIDSFARAHRHLYHDPDNVEAVGMRGYIAELCDALAQALTLHGAVTLSCASDTAWVDRDRAVTIGLLINELVTNAAKHAFNGRDGGRIHVEFRRAGERWRLIVSDDGVGIDTAQPASPHNGLGQRLVDAFVRQANGRISTESSAEGTRVTVDFEN